MAKKFGKVGTDVEAPKTGDKSASGGQKAQTTAHLLHTIGNQAGHVKTHLDHMSKPGTNPKEKQLDYEHAQTHEDGTIEHTQKLTDHIMANYPAEAKELKKLQDTIPSVESHTLHGRLASAITHHKGK